MYRWGKWHHCCEADGPSSTTAMRVPGGVLVQTYDYTPGDIDDPDFIPCISATSLVLIPCSPDDVTRFMATLGCVDDSEAAGQA